MKEINSNKKGFLYHIKRNFCNKVIIRLDKIINFCAEKRLIKEVEKTLDEAEEIKNFSKKFNENKESLKLSIEELMSQNDNYKTIIHGLFIHYENDNFEEIEKIFSRLGYEVTIKNKRLEYEK